MITKGTDATSYYYANNKRVPLEREDNLVAVKFKDKSSTTSRSTESHFAERLKNNFEPVEMIPKYDLHIFRSKPSVVNKPAQSTIGILRLIQNSPFIDSATIGYRQAPGSPDIMFSTKEFTAKFKEGITLEQIEDINSRNNVRILEKLDYAFNGFLLEAEAADGETGAVALANKYYESGLCEWANPSFIKRRHRK